MVIRIKYSGYVGAPHQSKEWRVVDWLLAKKINVMDVEDPYVVSRS